MRDRPRGIHATAVRNPIGVTTSITRPGDSGCPIYSVFREVLNAIATSNLNFTIHQQGNRVGAEGSARSRRPV
jgi:hypothetical protein